MKQLLFTYMALTPTCYPLQGPIGATLGTAMNNLYSSPKKVSTNYITWPFYFWIWRRSLHAFGPWGPSPWAPMYHMNNFESPAPKDDSCKVWLKSDHAFSRRRWNSYFLQRAPPQPVIPTGAHWGHPGNCHEQLLFFTQQGIYTLHNLTILLLDLEKKMFEICMVLALGALPLGATHTIWTTLNPLPPRMIPAKFG